MIYSFKFLKNNNIKYIVLKILLFETENWTLKAKKYTILIIEKNCYKYYFWQYISNIDIFGDHRNYLNNLFFIQSKTVHISIRIFYLILFKDIYLMLFYL